MRKYYDSCKTLPVFNFFEILESDNYRWLIKGYDGEDSEGEDEKAKEIWSEIFNEYSILKDDPDTKEKYRILGDIIHLEDVSMTLDALIFLYNITYDIPTVEKIAELLKQIGYPINLIDSKKTNTDKLISNQKGILTNIRRKKAQNKELFEAKKRDAKQSYEKDVADVEYVLEKNFIDTRKVTVARWIGYLKQVENKIKANKQNGNK